MGRTPRRFRIHLTTLGSSGADFVDRFGGCDAMLRIVREALGTDCRLTANKALLVAPHDEMNGGRDDDAERAREAESVLADDTIDALVTLRGGSWFCRILNRINFDVLSRRRRRLVIFGFSEMTPLVAIAGRYPNVLALYDMGPAWLGTGLKRQAFQEPDVPPEDEPERRKGFAEGFAAARLEAEFRGFFERVARCVGCEAPPFALTGRRLHGRLPKRRQIVVTGGNLSLIAPMLASRYADAFDTEGRWLAIEEIGEQPHQIDRLLAGLSLSGLLDKAEGILLGDFHCDDRDLCDAAYRILRRHLPARTTKPVIALEGFGHTWPLLPLPMHRPLTLNVASDKQAIQLRC